MFSAILSASWNLSWVIMVIEKVIRKGLFLTLSRQLQGSGKGTEFEVTELGFDSWLWHFPWSWLRYLLSPGFRFLIRKPEVAPRPHSVVAAMRVRGRGAERRPGSRAVARALISQARGKAFPVSFEVISVTLVCDRCLTAQGF